MSHSVRIYSRDFRYHLLFFLLLPLRILLSWLYGLGTKFRDSCYQQGFLRSRRLSCPVVSFGNLTAGGTGKTPLVIYLAGELLRRGKRVGILSRGYGRRYRESYILSGTNARSAYSEVGDEISLMGAALPQVYFGVGANRYMVGRLLLSSFPVDVLLLDDGFQYRSLYRNLDILVIDAIDPWGKGHFLPWGFLRENRRSIHRAQLLIVSRLEQLNPDERTDLLTEIKLLAGDIPVITGSFRLNNLRGIFQETIKPLEFIKGRPIVAFAGIGNHRSWEKDLLSLSPAYVEFWRFPDHYPYSIREWERLQNRAMPKDALLMTTEKDAVRLRDYPSGTYAWQNSYSLVGEWSFRQGEDNLWTKIGQILG